MHSDGRSQVVANRPEAASRGSLKKQRRFSEPAAGQIMPLGLEVALMTASSSTTV